MVKRTSRVRFEEVEYLSINRFNKNVTTCKQFFKRNKREIENKKVKYSIKCIRSSNCLILIYL